MDLEDATLQLIEISCRQSELLRVLLLHLLFDHDGCLTYGGIAVLVERVASDVNLLPIVSVRLFPFVDCHVALHNSLPLLDSLAGSSSVGALLLQKRLEVLLARRPRVLGLARRGHLRVGVTCGCLRRHGLYLVVELVVQGRAINVALLAAIDRDSVVAVLV